MYKYLKLLDNDNNYISSWESKRLSNGKISSSMTSNYSLAPKLVYRNARMKVEFTGIFLKQGKVTYTHGGIINIYIVYKLIPYINGTGVTLENCFFGAVEFTKNDDIDKYKYSGYGIGFDSKGTFSYPSDGFGGNVIIFGADMSDAVHANNKTKSILVLGEGFTQGLDNATFCAEKMYSINFSKTDYKILFKFVL